MENVNIEKKEGNSVVWIISAFLFGISLGLILALVKKEVSKDRCDCVNYRLDAEDDIFDDDDFDWEDETDSYSF
ncbi:MAG: hypothetical protein GX896_03915 [Clostridiales bacterium]|nr:hypothetical protein [Clostridiales bacterium]